MSALRRSRTHKEYHYALPCEGKNQYTSQDEAQRAADFHMLENMNIELTVYECPVCRFWHMTTETPYNWRDEMPRR